jgi:pSer/pThr/pTyr-binding forkhead associated (FHA) protein
MSNELSVTYMSGPLDGKTLYFPQPEAGEERVLLIGRREGCDIPIDFDNQASRVHAKLVIGAIPASATESVVNPFTLSFWLEDGGSRNGTYLEKEKSSIKGRVSLRPGTLFRAGRTWMRLDIPLSFEEGGPY